MSNDSWYVYILRCADGTYYTGTTSNIERRVDRHNKGTGARYTRSRLPVTLVWFSEPLPHGSALTVESSIKRLKRIEKEALLIQEDRPES